MIVTCFVRVYVVLFISLRDQSKERSRDRQQNYSCAFLSLEQPSLLFSDWEMGSGPFNIAM